MKDPLNLTNDKKVVIIGGGPAGLTAAFQLSKSGVQSIVLEKDSMVGGISRTVNYKNYHFDIGGHRFFTKVKEVEDIWKELLREDFLRRERLSRIYYNNKFFHYPLRLANAFFALGIWNSFLIAASYVFAKLFPSRDEESFEQWVSNRFGKRLFNVFFKTYTEKVWGIPCNEIRAEWAAQRIKGLSLINALKDALIKSNNSTGNKRKIIKTLIGEFRYPKFGPGMMWNSVMKRIKGNGSQVWLQAEVERIHWAKDRVESVEVRHNGKLETVSGTDFISSMPIREAIQKFNPFAPEEVLDAANKLKYRDFLTVALIINKSDVFPDNWIYIHDPGVKVGRIQNFKNWSPYMVPSSEKTCLGLEYFCFEGDDLWTMSDDQLIALANQELETLGFVNSEYVEDGKVVRMAKAYPVYDAIYKKSLEEVRGFLDGINNFQLVGRNGQHKYNNQDHSMLTAIRAAENILGAKHDLWQVNEEPEYHEESTEKILARAFARIDKLGLATALGTVFGLFMFFATFLITLMDGEIIIPYLSLLSQYFFGYTVSIKGSFIAMAYSFSWAFLLGWLFAYLRNLFIAFHVYRVKRNTEMLTFMDFIDHY
jgi:protoporphyrinogen oxidase